MCTFENDIIINSVLLHSVMYWNETSMSLFVKIQAYFFRNENNL